MNTETGNVLFSMVCGHFSTILFFLHPSTSLPQTSESGQVEKEGTYGYGVVPLCPWPLLRGESGTWS